MAKKLSRLKSKNTLMFVVAILMLLSGLASVSTGILMEATDSESEEIDDEPLLPGELADDLGEVHAFSGYSLAVLTLAHLVLNWRWTLGYLRGLGSRE